jgi:hypothetical protein
VKQEDETMERSEKSETQYGPALSVLGVKKAHAQRAIKWLKDRSFLAFYVAADQSLNMHEYPKGREWTYETMNKALEATR